MSVLTEITGYKIVLIKLLKEDISPDTMHDSEPIILDCNAGGSTCDTREDKNKDNAGKRLRDKNREKFVPKGAIIRRGRIYMANATE